MSCKTLSVLIVGVLSVTSWAHAADPWFELKDFAPLTQRVAVSVENPADVAVEAAVVRLPLAELARSLPDAKDGHVCVVDPLHAKPPKHDMADEEFVKFQVGGDQLIFMMPLKANEKRTVHVYTSPQRLNMPGFADGTSYDSRKAYRSFENRYGAFRIESGPGANTTGMVIDVFGKTKKGIGLRIDEFYQTGHDAYHELSYWGIDILKVGQGPGLGGVYLFAGDAMGRPGYADILVEPVYTGPIETKLRMTAPVAVGGKKVALTRHVTLIADDRTIHDEVIVEGDGAQDLQIGIGVRDLPNCVWVESPSEKGYGFQTGDANQPHYKAVGLGALFDAKSYVRTVNLPEKDPGHVYVLKGKVEGGKLVSRHRLAHIWDMDGQLEAPVDKADQLRGPFQGWFENWAKQRDNPVKATVGKEVEKKP